MLVVLRLFGALIGLSIGSTLFSSVFQHNISSFGELPEQTRILEDASQAISFIPTLRTLQLPEETMNILIQVYQQSFMAIWIFMTCCSGIGLVISLVIRELSLENEEVGRQRFEQSSG